VKSGLPRIDNGITASRLLLQIEHQRIVHFGVLQRRTTASHVDGRPAAALRSAAAHSIDPLVKDQRIEAGIQRGTRQVPRGDQCSVARGFDVLEEGLQSIGRAAVAVQRLFQIGAQFRCARRLLGVFLVWPCSQVVGGTLESTDRFGSSTNPCSAARRALGTAKYRFQVSSGDDSTKSRTSAAPRSAPASHHSPAPRSARGSRPTVSRFPKRCSIVVQHGNRPASPALRSKARWPRGRSPNALQQGGDASAERRHVANREILRQAAAGNTKRVTNAAAIKPLME